MMGVSVYIEWDRMEEALPAFLTCTLIAFTYSIANGVIAGLVAYALLKLAVIIAGKGDVGESEEGENAPMPSVERRKSGSMLAYIEADTISTPRRVKTPQYGAVQ